MCHFMLIDANAERRVRRSNTLRQQGVMVSEAETVRQAIEFSRRTEIDAIVIDTTAAETDGCKALDAFRREGITAPVVLLADRWDERLKARCEARGAKLMKKETSPTLVVAACAAAVAV